MSQAFRFPRSEDQHPRIKEDNRGYDKPEDGGGLQAENEFHDRSLSLPFLVASTCGLCGLQVVWSVILSHGTPFLISLGLSESLTALIWVAGPLCGVVIQPIMGALSDQSRISWGRRRPYILIGACGTIFSLTYLAWIEDVVKGLTRYSNGDPDSSGIRSIVIILAILGIYILNISIQPLQMGLRTLTIENCPPQQQTQASAWASRMTGVGNIIGYLAGFTQMSRPAASFSVNQFQGLTIIASVTLTITVGMSCTAISEENPESIISTVVERPHFMSSLRQLLCTYRTMPWKIRKVCQIQFCAWIGWFPFLFYSTTYISDLHSTSVISRDTNMSLAEISIIREDGVRIGTFASLIFAIVALLANVILPLLVCSGTDASRYEKQPITQNRNLSIRKLSIMQVWIASHLLFAIAMFSTIFVNSQTAGIWVIGFVGLSWALTLWAPFAIIGAEIATLREEYETRSAAECQSGAIPDCEVGVILSLHNIAISAPQIIAALACSGILGIAQLLGSSDATGWALRSGGFVALVAAWLCKGLIYEE